MEKHLPDWDGRMNYQKKQEKHYKVAMKKQKELRKLRIQDKPTNYTKQELDAMDYFSGTGFYTKHQDPSVRPNIFDSRQSLVIKMHDEEMRDNFLNSFNHINK